MSAPSVVATSLEFNHNVYQTTVRNVCTNLPQTISKAHACTIGVISNAGSPSLFAKFRTKCLTFSQKIGMNDCRIFKLNAVFKTLRCGFHIFTKKYSLYLNVAKVLGLRIQNTWCRKQ